MTSRVRVYNRLGIFLDELIVATERSWVLNDYGVCTFDIATADPKCTEKNLFYDNFVYITHPTLPDWYGIIETPRSWSPGVLTVTSLSLERMLALRAMTPNVTLTGTAGSIYSQMLDIANAQGGTLIHKPNAIPIYVGGDTLTEVLADSMFSHAQKLANESGQEFDCVAIFPNDVVQVYTHWYAKRSVSTGLTFFEGANSPLEMPDQIMQEQGDFWSEIVGYGDASTDGTRPMYKQRGPATFGKYNLRQTNQTFSGLTDVASVQSAAWNYLLSHNNPQITFTLSITDIKDAAGNSLYFPSLRLGNTFGLTLSSAGFRAGGGIGFQGNVRIIGMKYSDLVNKVELVVEGV